MSDVSMEDLAWYWAYDQAEAPKKETTRERFLRKLGPGVVRRAK